MLTAAYGATYILLAEDNPADVELVREALVDRQIKFGLHVVSDGEQAVSFIETIDCDGSVFSPKLFLLDLHLPKCDGEDVLCRFRLSKRCVDTPVVVMTSIASCREIEKTSRHKNVHYFRKPNSLEDFMGLGDIVKHLVGHGEVESFDAIEIKG